MKLTDGEKLITAMLADIIEHLGIKGEFDPAFIRTAVFGDDGWALKWKYSSLFHNEGPSDEVVAETAKIMTMCRVVETSISLLSEDERASIPEHKQQVFVGFDGNQEDHYGVAHTLVNELGQFEEFAERGLNSHHATLESYRAMLRAYDHMELPMNGRFPLNDIMTILEAPERA
jgi:uncharacterized protein